MKFQACQAFWKIANERHMLYTSNKESCVQLVHAGTDLGICGSVYMQLQTSYDQP